MTRTPFRFMLGRAAVMTGEAAVAAPKAGIGEAARVFRQDGAVRPLVDLHIHINAGNFQRDEVFALVAEIGSHLFFALFAK